MPLDTTRLRRRDRLWAHWYAFCATIGGSGLGLLIVLTTLVRHFSPAFPPEAPLLPPDAYAGWRRWMFPAPSLMALPEWQGLVLGLLLVVGGFLWTLATMTQFKYVEDFWKVLRAGLLMLVLGWFGYSFCAANMRPEWIVPWWLGLTHAIAYLGGFYLSMLHQWRIKGFPHWVVALSRFCAPFYSWVCRGVSAPFNIAERWFSKHSMSGLPSGSNAGDRHGREEWRR